MRISFQRQCDGLYSHPDAPRCEHTLELAVELPEIKTWDWDNDFAAPYLGPWEAAATAIGWRRINGPGESHKLAMYGGMIIVPSVKAWVSCPDCVKIEGWQNIRGVGGVIFDATEGALS